MSAPQNNNNNIKDECKIHNKKISLICLAPECKERSLCSSCFKGHDNHLSYCIPLNEFQDKDGKIIIFDEIESKNKKLKTEIGELKKSYYEKIENLFKKYLKQLKEEKLEKFFEEQSKKIKDNISNEMNNNKNLDDIAFTYNDFLINELEYTDKIILTIKETMEKSCIFIEKKLNYLISQIFLLNWKTVLKKIDNNYKIYEHGESTYGRLLLDNDSEKLYYINGCNINKIEIYSNFEDFTSKKINKVIYLPTKIAGTYPVIHKKYFYYFEIDDNNICNNKINKFDLNDQKIVYSEFFLPDDAVKDNKQNYWGGYNDSILISDSDKLYVVYSSIKNEKKINIALINEYDLSIIKIWETDSKIKYECPCIFIIDSVLYHLNSNSLENDTINYAYDLNNGKSFDPKIPFVNKGGYDSSLTYYPQIQSLMTVNNGNVYLYKVELDLQ